MQVYTPSDAGHQLQALMNQVIAGHEPIYIGNNEEQIVMISAEDYRSIQETLYLMSIPGMRKSILEGRLEKIEDCTTELPW